MEKEEERAGNLFGAVKQGAADGEKNGSPFMVVETVHEATEAIASSQPVPAAQTTPQPVTAVKGDTAPTIYTPCTLNYRANWTTVPLRTTLTIIPPTRQLYSVELEFSLFLI